MVEEYTREYLAVKVARRLTHQDMLEVLAQLLGDRGVSVHLRSSNGSEFTVKKVRTWLSKLEVKPLFLEPGNPWENARCAACKGDLLFAEGGTDLDRDAA